MDNRVWSSGASVSAPTAPVSPSTGYPTAGNPGGGVPATKGGAFWFHQIGEEIRAVIVAASLAPSTGTLTQLRDAIQALIAAAAALPAGATVFFPANVAPAGFIKSNGALVSRVTYASLWTYAQASGNIAANDGAWVEGQFSPGDGATTFRIPDLRGNFLRGWDDARGIDSGRAIGSLQLDAMQGHWHALYADGTGAGSGGGYMGLQSGGASLMAQAVKQAVSDGTNGTPRVAAETRPRNIALLGCIKY